MKYMMCLMLVILCGCSTKQSLIEIDRTPLKLSNPPPIKLNDVNFIIIHKDNAEKIFDTLEKSGTQPVIFGLTGDNYKSLSINVQEIKNYLILQKKIIESYRKYYEEKSNNQKN